MLPTGNVIYIQNEENYDWQFGCLLAYFNIVQSYLVQYCSRAPGDVIFFTLLHSQPKSLNEWYCVNASYNEWCSHQRTSNI